MFRTHVKVILRNLLRNKLFSIINITGLAVGLASFILIFLWVRDELAYDQFHKKIDRIYRVAQDQPGSGGMVFKTMQGPTPLAPVLKEKYAEVEEAVRVNISSPPILFSVGDRKFYEQKEAFVDPNFFSVFSFDLLFGDPKQVLSDPSSIVISRELALKYFDTENAVGRTLRIYNSRDVVVTGVLKDVPAQSSLEIDFLLPFETHPNYERNRDHWGSNWHSNFVLLREGVDADAFNKKIRGAIKDNGGPGRIGEVFIQPLSEVYLYTDWNNSTPRIRYVYILSIIAVLILGIACINFMNLSTARSLRRSREVGLRKVSGAGRSSLIIQFLTESVAMTLIALVVALLLTELFLPAFNTMARKELVVDVFSPAMMLLWIAILFGTGISAGLYPAFVLSSYGPASVLKANFHRGREGKGLRQTLVVFQFTLSVFLTVATLVIVRQQQYLQNANTGYDKENLLSIPLRSGSSNTIQALKSEFNAIPEVIQTGTSNHPLTSFGSNTWDVKWPGKTEDERILTTVTFCDEGFVKTIGINMAEGRAFSASDDPEKRPILVNQAAVKAMGLKDPVGVRLKYWDNEWTIVGVVKDFNYFSLRESTWPLVLMLDPEDASYLHLRLRPGNPSATIERLSAAWTKFNPAHPFEYYFVDDALAKLYEREKRLSSIFTSFATLAILISCLGLFGLASFTAEQRSREMGIRKVLGATVPGLVGLQAKDFLILVGIGNLIAWPLAYLAASGWLEEFAYRIALDWTFFAVAAIGSVLIAALTVSYQALAAAWSNPAEILKYE